MLRRSVWGYGRRSRKNGEGQYEKQSKLKTSLDSNRTATVALLGQSWVSVSVTKVLKGLSDWTRGGSVGAGGGLWESVAVSVKMD